MESGANVNILDNDGTSALLAAARKGHTETAKLLLEHGANVDILHGTSVFLDIVRNGYAETAKLLLELGAGMNMLDDHGRSTFFDVVRQGYTKTAKLLLELGVDVNVLDHTGTSALSIAIEYRHIEMVKLLLEHGADVIVVKKYDWQRFGLIIACQKNYAEMVKIFLEFRANIDVQDRAGWSALMHASSHGYIEVVKILLSHKPNLDLQAHDGSSALYLAIICQHTEICKLLLINGASLNLKYSCNTVLMLIKCSSMPVTDQPNFGNSEGKSALMVACIIKGPLSDEIVELLLDYDNNVTMQDEYGWSALTIASYQGNSKKIDLLLKHGAYVNLRYAKLNGWSALLFASGGHTSTTEVLLKYGADVNIQDNDGWSALMLTSQDGYVETAEVLLKYQADVNQKKNDGWSALMIASYNEKMEMIKLLVKHNADVNLLENEGWSALMIACKVHRVVAVKLLLGYGADVNILNNSGWSALMIANYMGCQEICELLLKHGAHASIENDELISSHLHIENLNNEITVSVTNSEQYFSWDQFGLNLYIPQDSLPKDIQQCTIHMKISTTSDHHQLPQNMHFVSPVYLIKCRPRCQFSKPLILEIQHCAKQDNIHKVCFIKSTSANLRFSTIDPGDGKADHVYYSCFPQHCSFGFIELDKFCKFAVAQTQIERDSCQQRYRANIFYERENPRRYKVHFVILWDIDAHNDVRPFA